MIKLTYLANPQGKKIVRAEFDTPYAGRCIKEFPCLFWWVGRRWALKVIARARKFHTEVVEA